MKAVRVKKALPSVYKNEILPEVGCIYTIREIVDRGNGLAFLLDEIRNDPREYTDGFLELAFLASRFRPVVDRKTDISFAHEILRTVTKTAPVDPAFERALADAGYMPTDRYVERNRT
jgi:hypothetical protein